MHKIKLLLFLSISSITYSNNIMEALVLASQLKNSYQPPKIAVKNNQILIIQALQLAAKLSPLPKASPKLSRSQKNNLKIAKLLKDHPQLLRDNPDIEETLKKDPDIRRFIEQVMLGQKKHKLHTEKMHKLEKAIQEDDLLTFKKITQSKSVHIFDRVPPYAEGFEEGIHEVLTYNSIFLEALNQHAYKILTFMLHSPNFIKKFNLKIAISHLLSTNNDKALLYLINNNNLLSKSEEFNHSTSFFYLSFNVLSNSKKNQSQKLLDKAQKAFYALKDEYSEYTRRYAYRPEWDIGGTPPPKPKPLTNLEGYWIDAYLEFIKYGNPHDLRNLIFPLGDQSVLFKDKLGAHFYHVRKMLFTLFEADSIKPLIYFLVESYKYKDIKEYELLRHYALELFDSMGLTKADLAAEKIQDAYHEYKQRKLTKKDLAAKKIQKAYHQYKQGKKLTEKNLVTSSDDEYIPDSTEPTQPAIQPGTYSPMEEID